MTRGDKISEILEDSCIPYSKGNTEDNHNNKPNLFTFDNPESSSDPTTHTEKLKVTYALRITHPDMTDEQVSSELKPFFALIEQYNNTIERRYAYKPGRVSRFLDYIINNINIQFYHTRDAKSIAWDPDGKKIYGEIIIPYTDKLQNMKNELTGDQPPSFDTVMKAVLDE
ncbi:hypothetical protein KA531_01095 [Candidatus Saccharibacteria bacterium]|nr:hypothetical protein [Candidatus Saccharibacteria bacterium]